MLHFFKNSFSNRKCVSVFALLFFAYCSQAQDYVRKLDWQEKAKSIYTIEEKTIVQPTFTNAVHDEQFGLLPVYKENIPLTVQGEVSIQLSNAVYSTSTHVDNASLSFIKDNLEAKAEISFQRKKPSAAVFILPFRKNPSTGVIEKLESFTIRLVVTPKGQHRSTQAYTASSVLASGNWYKVATTTDGIYKIDYNFIKTTLGVDPAGFNLSSLAIFGNGGGMVPDKNSDARPDDLTENPTLVVDNNGNNKLDDGDYLLFYGEMADAWVYNPATPAFVHHKNLYTDKAYYFLTTTSGTGKRATLSTAASSPNKTITDFDDRAFHESDEYNLLRSGKEWLGDKMTGFSNTKSFSYNFPNLITSVPVRFTSYVGSKTNYGSSVSVTINGQAVLTQNEPGINPNDAYPNAFYPVLNSITYNTPSNQLDINYTFSVSNDPAGTAAAYINYFEINLKRALTLTGDAMPFRNISSIGVGNISQFNLENASGATKIWDITSIGNIQEMQTSLNGSQLSFITTTDGLKEFIAFNVNGSFPNPEKLEQVSNQNLHAMGEPDMVIITPDDFVSACNDLADFHRQNENISVNVVMLSQVYNEFASGKPDISAIRDLMKMLYDRAGTDTALMPRYLLLMGDGSYDPKGRIANSNNFISTYQSYETVSTTGTYTSDDFFGLLDNNEGGDITSTSQQMDIGVGRLPVASATEAQDVVNKIKNYKKPAISASCVQLNSNNSWRNMLTFVADDMDQFDGTVFENYTENLAESNRASHPVYNFEKIYSDAFKQLPTPAGDRYPEVNTAILNRINSGTLIMNWVGHGGETNWAHERIFNMADIIPLENKEKLPLFITATCEFSRYDLPDRTAGEWLVVNGKGGAIGAITTVRLVYQSANEVTNTAAFHGLFDTYEGRFPTLGEAVMVAKNSANSNENNRKFTLLGDPALTLNYPRYNVATIAVNNKPVVMPHDTLKALSQVTITGEVQDDNGNKLTSFNGVVYPLVYDKLSTLQTLGNDQPIIFPFKMYKNVLFKGKASVTNGSFSFSFMVPKDINYQYGSGRISYYADNGNYIDAHGYSTDIVIGGSADNFTVDHAGPKMDLYMNDEKFVFGGTTNADPMLLMKLTDESGINTVGNGIGHDMTAILDDNTQNKVILNDYYESELDNYKKGAVKYPYTKLVDGKHTLKVKAWDIQNNSTEEYTEFIVASDAKLALSHVFNYPNPFTTHTEFMFEHNRSCDDLNVSVQVFSVSGKLVKNIVEYVHSDGFRVSNINWDGLDDYGDAIGKGVYVYKLTVRDSEGQTAHKFEKLVVLR